MSNEKAKLNALKEALQKSMAMYNTGKSWGNMMLDYEAEEKMAQARKAAEKAARNKADREKAEKAAAANAKRAKIIANHKAKFMTPSGLKQIAKECKWHCEGKTCFAHKAGVCPYIHKGGPGSSKATGITLKNTNSKKKGHGATRKSRRL